MARSSDVDTQVLDDENDYPSVGELLLPLGRSWGLLLVLPVLAGAIGFASSYVVAPRYGATTSFLPPHQAQSAAASALAALGPLTALAGAGGAVRTPGDQFVALMRSVTVSDRIVDRFDLIKAYEADYRFEARRSLNGNVQISLGKKDGLISIEVEDTSPQRAAEIANQYVEELRRLTSGLAITEAQQRRVFFERQLQQTREQLQKAQVELQGSGFNPGALKAEPKAAAETYAKLKAEVVAAEVRLQALRGSLADGAPEVQQVLATLSALRSQLARVEQPAAIDGGPDYVSRYREYKYREALFEVYARQFELARVDESREGALIQVIDVAQPPERKTKPRRSLWLAFGAVAGLIIGVVLAYVRSARRLKSLV